jgi:general secretion pathway protein G
MKRAGFTLIELLIVIAIIGVLAGLVMVSVLGTKEKAEIAVAKTTIKNLELQLGQYYDDVGFYPPGNAENDEGNINMVLALSDLSAAEGGKGGPNSPYFEFKTRDLKPSQYSPSFNVFVDPWGEPWRYVRVRDESGNRKEGVHGRYFDLWSCGPNMKDDKGENDKKEKDDVANWH